MALETPSFENMFATNRLLLVLFFCFLFCSVLDVGWRWGLRGEGGRWEGQVGEFITEL